MARVGWERLMGLLQHWLRFHLAVYGFQQAYGFTNEKLVH